MNKTKFTILPSGVRVVCGGSRTTVKLDRPWQVGIPTEEHNCPFERDDWPALANFDTVSGWRLLQNQYTPFSWHRLLVPAKCWPEDKLRTLGGSQEIECALSLAMSVIGEVRDEFWFGVHVGFAAGQNSRHLHYHLLKPFKRSSRQRPDDAARYCRSLKEALFRMDGLKAVLGGARSGQCYIVPQGSRAVSHPALKYAQALSKVIGLFNEKFRSTQGLAPDYLAVFRLAETRISYASYTPILNNWGMTEYMGILEGTPLVLPWPHAQTAKHLKS